MLIFSIDDDNMDVDDDVNVGKVGDPGIILWNLCIQWILWVLESEWRLPGTMRLCFSADPWASESWRLWPCWGTSGEPEMRVKAAEHEYLHFAYRKRDSAEKMGGGKQDSAVTAAHGRTLTICRSSAWGYAGWVLTVLCDCWWSSAGLMALGSPGQLFKSIKIEASEMAPGDANLIILTRAQM